MNYQSLRETWAGSYGIGIRALLSLEDSSGAFNWFHDTCEHFKLRGFYGVTIGDMCDLMLNQKQYNLLSLRLRDNELEL